MNEHREWQRTTALRRIERLREDQGNAIPETRLAAEAAQYVGSTAGQVRAWMRGAK
jgi:hypothetical protein